ncbi:glycosyltransferase [Proteus mirabilis]|nr:glycosyltransferase [Proteus mirabilis]EMD6181547.1 glycosyltransferase [Proteus mirabilis]
MIKNICLITTSLGMGGAEHQLCNLADGFIENNKKVIIISLSSSDILVRPKSKHVKIHQINMKKNPFSFIKSLFIVRKILIEFNPDIIHSHMFHANIFSRILKIIFKHPKLITTAHSSNEGGFIRMFIYRTTDFLSSISTNVSKEAVNSFIEKKASTKNRLIPIYNGIDIDKFTYNQEARNEIRNQLNINDNVHLFLAVGRLTKAKDYPNLLKAFSKFEYDPNIALAIIGIGEEEIYLKNLISELKIKNRVFWLGLKNNIADWMSASDTFVLSSAWEGFGLVVAEAMSCKRIVIATDSGGVSEVMDNIGFLVPTKDSKLLFDAMNHVLSLNNEEKKLIGEQARRKILQDFSLPKIIDTWLKLYEQLEKNEKENCFYHY